MDNYQFCAEWARDHSNAQTKVLDYGCGAGQIVDLLATSGLDAHGCDVFYEGGDYSTKVPPHLHARIKRMDDGKIPFPAASFDLVINNQVMEHVPDLPAVLAEIDRVLKPGGVVLSLFPHRETWRENHCGVPLLHRFPKGSRARVAYAFACRSLGAGLFKNGKPRLQWSEDFCRWLDAWTYYRPLAVIRSEYAKRFGALSFIEPQFWDKRTPLAFLPSGVKTAAVRKLGGVVFEARRG